MMTDVRLEPDGDALRAVFGDMVLRVLFSDGRTVDVTTSQDDSRVRAALVKWAGGDVQIVGVATLDAQGVIL